MQKDASTLAFCSGTVTDKVFETIYSTCCISDTSGGKEKRGSHSAVTQTDRWNGFALGMRDRSLLGCKCMSQAAGLGVSFENTTEFDNSPGGYCLMFPGCEFLD